MSRETWRGIIKSKSFYTRTYRACLTGIVISVLINLFLSLWIYYRYFHMPPREFYATSGILPPIMLTPLSEPNNSGTPLLAEEEAPENTIKVIPH